jgi:predicted secreted Zn-dependent protease
MTSTARTARGRKIRLEKAEGGSSKFWKARLEGTRVVTRSGRTGTDGREIEKRLATAEAARFTAYTDWEIEWVGFTIHARAVVTLPVWHAPPTASPGLLREWDRFAKALETHEGAHVAFAEEAAQAATAALRAGEDPRPKVSPVRLREIAFDAATRHGHADGAILR